MALNTAGISGLERFLGVRADERRPVWSSFAALLAIVVGHTVLETARDALFLQHVGVKSLGLMYIVSAALTLAVGSIAAGVSVRFGARRALVAVQLTSAAIVGAFFFMPPTRLTLMALYAFTAVSGALLVPQLWVFAAALFQATQSRRLFGTIALAGVLGAVLGSSSAAAILLAAPVELLLLAAAAAYLASAAAVAVAPRMRASVPAVVAPEGSAMPEFRREPLLLRLALVVALGSVTTLLVDYCFKASVAQHVPAAGLGSFFARYYGVMNLLALIVQLAVARRLVARAGVIGAAGMLPSLLLVGASATLLSGGALLAVAATKAFDATFRHSVHRTTTELVYLALPTTARTRAKPLIDGAVVRVSQAVTAGFLLLLAYVGWDSVPQVALFAVAAAALWGATTYALRAPYLALFRRSLLGARPFAEVSKQELDLASVELLVEALASPRSREVIAAMSALERRGRTGLIPALVLLHDDEEVLECALDILGNTVRKDWPRLAERHVTDSRERVRRAALRALARARLKLADSGRQSAAPELARDDQRPWIRGYLAIAAPANGSPEPQSIQALLDSVGTDALEAKLGVLVAIGDLPPAEQHADILAAMLTADETGGSEVIDAYARASAHLGDPRPVPWLTSRLAHREGREPVRRALVLLGEPGYHALAAKLLEPGTDRRLRSHLPRTLARFGSQAAADLLFELLKTDADGLVRYKCLRGLGALVVGHGAKLPARGLRALTLRDLTEHFRLLALSQALESAPALAVQPAAAARARTLLLRLLGEKSRQAVERVFRLLKLSFPQEDIHRVHTATVSGSASDRANAAEFLDALLAPRNRRPPEDDVRPLLRLLNEDGAPAEILARAAELGGFELPTSPRVLAVLLEDRDVTVASLAVVAARGDPQASLSAAAASAEQRASVAESLTALVSATELGGAHG